MTVKVPRDGWGRWDGWGGLRERLGNGRQVHQFVPSMGFRDAVGAHAVQTRRALHVAGFAGAIWAEDIQPQMAKEARPADVYESRRTARRRANVLMYQLANGSRGLVSRLVAWPQPKTLYYHNITPSRFFDPWEPDAALNLARGREELHLLAPHVRLALANSHFSAAELRAVGIEDVRVVPPYLPPSVTAEPDPAELDWLRRTKRGLDLLYVSRMVPHKGHLQLLRAFAVVQHIDPGARLVLVGAPGPDAYMRALFRLRDRLGLDRLVLTGSVAASSLAAHYRHADVFVSLSEHEGFGLPLVEAMRQGVPVVAYDAAAVGETMDGAGVLLPSSDPLLVGEVVVRVGQESALREKLVEQQLARVARLDAVPRDRLLVEAVLDAAHGAASPAADAGAALGSH